MTRIVRGDAYERLHPCVVVLWPSPDCLPGIGVATCCERMEGELLTADEVLETHTPGLPGRQEEP